MVAWLSLPLIFLNSTPLPWQPWFNNKQEGLGLETQWCGGQKAQGKWGSPAGLSLHDRLQVFSPSYFSEKPPGAGFPSREKHKEPVS